MHAMTRTLGTILLITALPMAVYADDKPDPAESAPSKFATVDGHKVHYKSLGEGTQALVFVHGWSCNHTVWKFQTPDLVGKMRILLIDLPGHGKSDRPQIKYTMDLFARAIDAVMTDAGIEKAILAGHSMGTPVVRQFYRLYPKKTLGLVAVDGRLKAGFTDKKQVERFMSQFKGPEFKKNLLGFVDSMFSKETKPEIREFARSTVSEASQHVAVSAFEGMVDPEIWKDDKIEVPTQVIIAKGPYWTQEYHDYVKGLVPELDYRVMEGVGHFLMIEKPDAFNAILLEFLKKQKFVKEE